MHFLIFCVFLLLKHPYADKGPGIGINISQRVTQHREVKWSAQGYSAGWQSQDHKRKLLPFHYGPRMWPALVSGSWEVASEPVEFPKWLECGSVFAIPGGSLRWHLIACGLHNEVAYRKAAKIHEEFLYALDLDSSIVTMLPHLLYRYLSCVFLFKNFYLNVLGWHWWARLYRFQVYTSMIRDASCALHPKSHLLSP